MLLSFSCLNFTVRKKLCLDYNQTTILQPLYRSTCVRRHLQLTAGGFCWCKVLLPACLCWLQLVQLNYWVRSLTYTHTRLMALCPGLSGWAGTRKVKPIWILLEQETVSGSSSSWAICKSAPRSRQPRQHPTIQFFCRPDALPATQPTASNHWSLNYYTHFYFCTTLPPSVYPTELLH